MKSKSLKPEQESIENSPEIFLSEQNLKKISSISKRGRGSVTKNRGGRSGLKRHNTAAIEENASRTSVDRQKSLKPRGRPRGSSLCSKRGRICITSATKASKSASAAAAEDNVDDLANVTILDSPEEIDEADHDSADSADYSEYAPSEDEQKKASTKRPKSTTVRTRRQTNIIATHQETDEGEDDDEDEEDDDDEDEEDDDDDDETSENDSEIENTFSLVGEISELQDASKNDVIEGPFQMNDPNNEKDIYDFDAQSVLSDKRIKSLRRRGSRATPSAKVSNIRQARSASAASASWGSNIYSALATSLKTRFDLNAYTNFLKCPYLNNTLDSMFVDMCKPSNQHSCLFFGPSSSLQSLLGRVNDPDRVVELLQAFMSKPYDNLANRILWFIPLIHQQPVPLSNLSSLFSKLPLLSSRLDPKLRIEPAYILDPSFNVLVQNGTPFTDLIVSLSQFNAINSAGNLGRFMNDVSQIVISNDFYEFLSDLVSLPAEQIIRYAENVDGPESVNIDALEPPCLHRLIATVNSDGQLIGISVIDTWGIENVPLHRNRQTLEFANLNRPPIPISNVDKYSHLDEDLSTELDSYNVLENIIDSVSANEMEKSTENKFSFTKLNPKLGRIHLMDCFLLKPNGRKDTLLLVCYEPSSSPPLAITIPGRNPFRIYSLIHEEGFFYRRFGIASDLPALMDGMVTADPEMMIDRKALMVLPNILFDNLRSVCLREIVAFSGSAIVNAVLTHMSSMPVSSTDNGVYHCKKYILVDRQRRVPLAVVFEVPIRLSWSTDGMQCYVRSSDTSIHNEFSSISKEHLKEAEAKFNPNAKECRLVSINGLMYALQIDENLVLQRIIELAPALNDTLVGSPDHASLASQALVGDARSFSTIVRVINEENATASVFPAVFFPRYNQNLISEHIISFCDEIVDHLYTSPVAFSLYDVVFRMALKHTPKILARQHREAAVAAASAAAAANPLDPPPAPVPLPEHWGVCCICSKELHSVNGLLEHELRHVGLTRYRCDEHGVCFIDRKALLQHINEHSPNSTNVKTGLVKSQMDDFDSDQDDEDEDNRLVTSANKEQLSLRPSLSQMFSKNFPCCRMEAPQCENCRDYFATADVMAQHIDLCDGSSFRGRFPINLLFPELQNNSPVDKVEFGCGLCGHNSLTITELQNHFSELHLSCAICKSKLRTVEELSYHYKVHIDELNTLTENVQTNSLISQIMTCETCLTFYCTKYNYYFHQWADHGIIYQQSESDPNSLTSVQVRIPRIKLNQGQLSVVDSILSKLKCKFCNFLCPISGRQYLCHLKEAHDVNTDINFICRVCAEIFSSSENLSDHLRDEHSAGREFTYAGPQTIFSCDQCAFFAFSKGMLHHSREIHNNLSPMMYGCPHCNQHFCDRRVWRSHLEKHTDGLMHTCSECGSEFRSRQALLSHIQTRHFYWDDGPSTCEHCGITYPKQSSLRYHIARMHNQDMEYECPVCQQRFRIETYLRRHMKETHSGSIQCEICQKMCANLRCYSQHRQKHFRTKIFQCKECSATFKSKTAMRRHVRVEHMQLGPEKFECQICGKIVTQIGMHMLTHKDARFICEYCGKRFTKSVYYNEHIRIHRGELPFECRICRRRFNKKSNLNVHIRFHEKHRDEEGNYLELKARGRVSLMFGDASLTHEERAAKDAALRMRGNKPKTSVACGSDYPGAFNIGGPAGAASDAAARACPFGPDVHFSNSVTKSTCLGIPLSVLNGAGDQGQIQLLSATPYQNFTGWVSDLKPVQTQ